MWSVSVVLVLAAAPVKIASPAWNVVDLKPELASFYAEQLATALRTRGLKVTTASDIATLLGTERQRQLLGCDTESSNCLAELANALGCDATLTVNLARLGTGFRGLAKVMSSRDGSVLSSVRIDANDERQLSDRLEEAASVLAAPFVGAGPPHATTRFVAPTAWWVPGLIGLVPLGVGAVFLGLAGGQFDTVRSARSSGDALAASSAGEGDQTVGWILGGVGVAALAGSVLWLTLGGHSEPVMPTVSLAPGQASVGVRGAF